MKRFNRRLRRLMRSTGVWVAAAAALPIVAAAVVLAAPPDRSGAVRYTVERGDTLTRIARQHDVNVEAIVQANGLPDPDFITVGQVLSIPTIIEATHLHTVRRGETLAQIATRYDTTMQAVIALNDLSGVNDIREGMPLRIPAGEGGPTAFEGATYTLKRGDSLYRLSLIYGVPVEDILAANALSGPNAIYPGMRLRIPAPTADQAPSTTHTVRLGDTLTEIAYQYNTTVDGLMAANGLRGTTIYAGQALTVPQAGAPARSAPAQTGSRHTVQAGETLGEIALRYNVTVHTLAVANGLSSPTQIYPGLALSVPAVEAGTTSVQYSAEGRCEGVTASRTGTGYFVRPTRNYVITRGYFAAHPGIDLATALGTPVVAADGGTVVYSGWNTFGYGNLVVLDHGNGWLSYYAHLSRIDVGCGAWVPRGSTLGAIGSTGNSTGPHLHFELLRFGIAIDPAAYIRF